MARAEHEVQKIIDTLGLELLRELVGKPLATEEELKLLIKEAIRSAKRRVEVKVHVQPYENEKERVESILEWLRSQKGSDNGNLNQ